MNDLEDIGFDAAFKACTSTSGHQERWKKLIEQGASDIQLKEQIAYEFGISGGRTTEYGRIDYSGGADPELKVIFSHKPDPFILRGPALLAKVREVFRIPDETHNFQPKLF